MMDPITFLVSWRFYNLLMQVLVFTKSNTKSSSNIRSYDLNIIKYVFLSCGCNEYPVLKPNSYVAGLRIHKASYKKALTQR